VIQGGPEIRDFNLDQVMNQEFLVSEMQRVLCAVDSFEQITKRHMRRNGGFRT
jgi:phenylalanine-4-hydroxylase